MSWGDATAGVLVWRIGRIGILTYISPNPITGGGSGNDTVVTTLPSGWRPVDNTASVCNVVNGAAYTITLQKSGRLYIYSMTGTGSVRANMAYVINAS